MRVSPQVVSRNVCKFKKAGHMQHLLEKVEQEELKQQVIKTMVECMILEDKIIDSAESVAKRIKEEVDVDIKPWYIRKVMSKSMGMRYRKILKASFHVNSS